MTAAIIIVLHLKTWALGTLASTCSKSSFQAVWRGVATFWVHFTLGVAQITSDSYTNLTLYIMASESSSTHLREYAHKTDPL